LEPANLIYELFNVEFTSDSDRLAADLQSLPDIISGLSMALHVATWLCRSPNFFFSGKLSIA
jgi:hypothetical protein